MIQRLRRIALARQGLLHTAPFGRGIAGALRAIERLGYVQIDTLAVVQRAHHHVLWSRVPGYEPDILNRLVGQRRIFEYWAHAAAFLPMADYRFSLPRMRAIRAGENRYFASADPRLMASILDRIRIEGPLRMRQFETGEGSRSGSWNWGPLRRAFDRLFMQGDLMVIERSGMEKRFDLAERWLPPEIDDRLPGVDEVARHLLDRTLAAHGAVRRDQILHARPGKPVVAAVESEIARRLADHELTEVRDDDGTPYWISPALLDAPLPPARTTVSLLSPFDNAVIHRERLAGLFGLEYRLECYVPEDKRRFGYFCLPVLSAGQFAGLIDCKADRAARILAVTALHLPDRLAGDRDFLGRLAQSLQAFAGFNQCDRVAPNADVARRHALPEPPGAPANAQT